jgi:signal transduction histidine kinase
MMFWRTLGSITLLFFVTFSAAAEPKQVVLLCSFGQTVLPWCEYTTQFREQLELQSPDLVNIYQFDLETHLFAGPNEKAFLDYINAQFSNRKVDLVVTIGAPAAIFVQQNRGQLPATPLLMTAIEQRRVPAANSATDAVVATSIDIRGVVDTILSVLPETSTIAVVIGNSSNEKFWLDQLREAVEPFTNRVTFLWFNELSFDEMLERIATLPPKSAIFYALLTVDARGNTIGTKKAFSILHASANAPMFSYSDVYFGRGIVGGPLNSAHELGRQAASVAVRILRGETVGEIKTPAIGPNATIFDWRELQRWNIGENILPPGSEIRFRELDIWGQYRLEIFGIIGLLLVQAALITWLVYEHDRREKAEAAARHTMIELAHSNRVATAGELSASIAHEVNQPLSGMVTRANAALRWLVMNPPDLDNVRTALTQIIRAGHHAADIITSVRALYKRDVNNKAPVEINKLILTVLSFSRLDREKCGIATQIQLGDLPTMIGNAVQLQQVIMNLVMNAIEAMQNLSDGRKELRITSEVNGTNLIRVSIEDSGPGISPPDLDRVFKPMFTTKPQGMGMGLSICRSIIESHNGRIWASPGVNGGTIFQFELPTAPRSAAGSIPR